MRLAHVRGPGQPDQACDFVAASIVEEYLRRDPEARLNIHVTGGRGVLFVSGEVLSLADFDVSAIVRRSLAQAGYVADIEPFIAFEQLSPSWAPKFGSRELIMASGYATSETSSHLPTPVHHARLIARQFEQMRVQNPEWFWLGSDYEVWLMEQGQQQSITIRAQHVETVKVDMVRETLTRTVASIVPKAICHINRAGDEHKAGLLERVGSSRRTSSALSYGSALPASGSWAGTHLTHGEHLGRWLCRKAALDLLKANHGQAIFVQACWLPFETKPIQIRIRNEQGKDLSNLISTDQFNFELAPKTWLDPAIATADVRYSFDPNGFLPWEV